MQVKSVSLKLVSYISDRAHPAHFGHVRLMIQTYLIQGLEWISCPCATVLPCQHCAVHIQSSSTARKQFVRYGVKLDNQAIFVKHITYIDCISVHSQILLL